MIKVLQNSRRKIILTVSVIFLVALLPRLFLAFYSTALPISDASEYDHLAINILYGKGFSDDGKPNAFREPLYPYFLASIYYTFGYNYMAVRIIQALFGALICIIIFYISGKLFDFKTGLISALIASFNPAFIKITEQLLSENFYIFILIIAIFFLFRQVHKKGINNLVFLGLALGIAALTRSIIFLFPLFIIFLTGRRLVPKNYSIKKYILTIFILIFFFILPISVWTLRNWLVFHKFIPIVSRTGIGLYISYFPKDGKFYGFNVLDATNENAKFLTLKADQTIFWVKETLKFIKNNPTRFLKLEFLKTLYFWSPFDWEIIGYGVYNFMYGFIVPFFICGVFITLKRFRELLPIYLPIIYSFFIALVTYGSPRFRLPIEPYLIIIASVGITYFIGRFSKKVYPILITSGYLLLNLFFYVNSYQLKIVTRNIFEKIHIW